MIKFLKENKACEEAIDWVKDRNEKQAFQDCKRADWMLWYLAKKGIDTTELKRLCANTVKHLARGAKGNIKYATADAFADSSINNADCVDTHSVVALHAAYAIAASKNPKKEKDRQLFREEHLSLMADMIRQNYQL